MRAQAEAQSDQSKKNRGRSQKNGGDLHAIMDQVQKMNKKLEKHLKTQSSKSHKKRVRLDVDSDQESDKNLDSDNFHLDLEETSINAEGLDDDLSELDWSGEQASNKEADE
jgi:hypothetical protein